jgi:hypothetical protein
VEDRRLGRQQRARVTVDHVDAGQVDNAAPPRGTAIVRPLRHVRAVRERFAQLTAVVGPH